jgi:tetratricopeptide (TPR) repeat protein
MDTKRPAEAELAFRQAIFNKPDHEAANRNLGFVLKEIRHLTEAEAACRRAVDAEPKGAIPRYKLGQALMALGKLEEAIANFNQVIVLEPDYADAHNNLGIALGRQKRIDGAIACYLKAISIKPDFVNAMANLGAAFFMKGDLQQAAKWNQAALTIEPAHMDANQNMGLILLETGHRDEAKQYLDRTSGKQILYIEHATDPMRTVLVLWASKPGNVPSRAIELLFPANINTRVNWIIASAQDDQTDNLPNYDLVFNALGDPDLTGDSSGPVNRFTAVCAKPLLNHPDKVARTARNKLPALLNGIDNIVVPPVWRFASSTDWDESVLDQLPMLVRPVDSHGGTGLKLASTATELAQCRALQDGPVYVCPFKDFRSADSWFRKYRVIFVDRKPYPYHLAISPNWMVHYYTAEMESNPWKLEEEKEFLQRPEGVLGPMGMQSIQAIGARMDLEYSGIDFSILSDKRILVFEANPTMLVHAEDISGPLEHKNEYIFQIQDAFKEMLKRICSQ